MNILELKGSLHEMVATVEDETLLLQLHEIVWDFVMQHQEEADSEEELSEAEQAELKAAMEESEDENNLVAHEEVMQKYSKWLK
jgi:hypothetical protein